MVVINTPDVIDPKVINRCKVKLYDGDNIVINPDMSLSIQRPINLEVREVEDEGYE